jgi:predicted phosphodiesterase
MADKIAILSDIHANAEALSAVLDDIRKQRVTCIFNLGDAIGYGPDPISCLYAIQAFDLNLKGNHEAAILYGAFGFSREAQLATYWTQKIIKQKQYLELLNFLFMLSPRADYKDWILVHGSPCDAVSEYLNSDAISNEDGLALLDRNFNRIQNLCFVGHTHTPGFFVQRKNSIKFIYPTYINNTLKIDTNAKYIINPGSVGQPRDGNPKASYILVDGDTISWKRISYNYEKTIAKIQSIPELPINLGRRLALGH